MTMTLDNQQWSGGDWGRGISQLQITQKHCHTQRHQGDYGGGGISPLQITQKHHHSQCHQGNTVWGIQLLLRDDDCHPWK